MACSSLSARIAASALAKMAANGGRRAVPQIEKFVGTCFEFVQHNACSKDLGTGRDLHYLRPLPVHPWRDSWRAIAWT